jgi:hypothetical protein
MNFAITLNATNCVVKAVSHKNNLIVDILNPENITVVPERNITAVIHKKYFNQIGTFGSVSGRLRATEDGLIIFEGFSFR